MTPTEIQIIEREYAHQESLCSEMSSNKSYAGTMASISAFIVMEWLKVGPSAYLASLAIACLLMAAGLFLWLAWGQDYPFPSESENWLDWRVRWRHELDRTGRRDTSDEDLQEEYWTRVLTTLAVTRSINRRKSWLIVASGACSIAPVVIAAIDTFIRAF